MTDKNNNSGYRNSGYRNSGDCNSGYRNSGYYNSGDYNSGDCNSGYYNSGDYNSGYFNSGYYNSGDYNSGDYNSGNYNSGDYNSGDYNSGDYNSGWFNTDEPKMRFFGKDSEYTYSEFHDKFDFIYPDLKVCAWIDKKDMSEEEKNEVSDWSDMGGYLKTLDYKEAWSEYWNRASDDEKQWFQNLPNFDPKIFEEITGIDIKTKKETIEIGGILYDKGEVGEKLKGIKPVK